MVFVQLSDEEKLQVLLLAFVLFLVSLLVSVCLAATFCPLNKWLLERQAKKRRSRHLGASNRSPLPPIVTRRSPHPTSGGGHLLGNVYQSQGQHRWLPASLFGSGGAKDAPAQRYHRQQHQSAAAVANGYTGPPPAYEAALRATRLQSISGTLPPFSAAAAAEWQRHSAQQLGCTPDKSVAHSQQELDLGDYFHQPKEPLFYEPISPHVYIPMAEQLATTGEPIESAKQPPIMLRLWVRLMEPGELVARARGPATCKGAGGGGSRSGEQSVGGGSTTGRRLSLSRQLSIPQLIGSLVNLAAGAGAGVSKQPGGTGQEEAPAVAASTEQRVAGEQQIGAFSSGNSGEFSSIASDTTTTGSLSSANGDSAAAVTPIGAPNSDSQAGAVDNAALQQQPASQETQPSPSAAAANNEQRQETLTTKSKSETNDCSHSTPANRKHETNRIRAAAPETAAYRRSRAASFSAASPITSRVLHMNVASFSYVKDETVISAKKHNQMNYHHFYLNRTTQPHQSQADGQAIKKARHSSGGGGGGGKVCQLVISICDIENVLNSSWLNERSCALLTNNSAIYVQCEILTPKSKAARLLRNPLKALQLQQQQPTGQQDGMAGGGHHQHGSSSSKTHTVNFCSAISAAAAERHIVIPIGSGAGGHLSSSANSASGNLFSSANLDSSSSSQDVSLISTGTDLLVSNGSQQQHQPHGQSSSGSSDERDRQQQQQETTTNSRQRLTTNWRHEPTADGKSIVVFSSIPKQVAHQQQLAAAADSGYGGGCAAANRESGGGGPGSSLVGGPDLIQFDSVFVSPILNRSTIEDGYIRLRVYSQSKYVNETCLAELKLPLRQLLQSESCDNLGDAGPDFGPQQQQPQADFILDNLLTNLVTASTGSPLSTLIEQISSEERDAAAADDDEANNNVSADCNGGSGSSSTLGQAFRLPWLSAAAASNNNKDNNQAAGKLRPSCSFNDSLYRLADWANTQASGRQSADGGEEPDDIMRRSQEQEEALERRIEENYCRSLMVSHWFNYLVAPSYECQPIEEARGKIILGLTYLPTSNRVIFNAHRASIDNESYAQGKHMMKNLRLQTSTCYLLRLLMVVNGRVVKRRQTPVSKKPEWDSQEAITFDLVSVSVEQPSFIVALVMRNAQATGGGHTGSLQNLPRSNYSGGGGCNCPSGGSSMTTTITSTTTSATSGRPTSRNNNNNGGGQSEHCVHSEPESLQYYNGSSNGGSHTSNNNDCCNLCNQPQRTVGQLNSSRERDLVIGHLVLGDKIWRELRAQPRKQIVRQFKMY